MSAVHLDLRAWKRVDPPKFKKDYPGKMLRIREQILFKTWEYKAHEYVEKADPLLPLGAVVALRTRYTNSINADGEKQAILVCDWLCPCCGHKHERNIQESLLAEGKVEFVEAGDGLAANPADIIYLACPYTAEDPKLRQDRWLAVSAAAAWLMLIWGYTVLSPVSMGHPISFMSKDRLGHDFAAWEKTSLTLLGAATHLVVLLLPGVSASAGVRAEIGFARKKGLPIWTLHPHEHEAYRIDRAPILDGDGHESA